VRREASATHFERSISKHLPEPLRLPYRLVRYVYRWLRAMDRVTAVGIVQYLSLLIASQAGGSSEWYVPLTKFSSALSQGRKMERLGRWWSCLRDVLKTGLTLTSGREDGPQTWRRLLESSAAAAYYVFDNIIFLSICGMVESKLTEVVHHSDDPRRNGWIVARMGGISTIKRLRNIASVLHCCTVLPAEATEISSGNADRSSVIEVLRNLIHLVLLRLKIKSNLAASAYRDYQHQHPDAPLGDGHDVHHHMEGAEAVAVPLLGIVGILLRHAKKVLRRHQQSRSVHRSISCATEVSLLSIDSDFGGD
jgi:hypothetical protein